MFLVGNTSEYTFWFVFCFRLIVYLYKKRVMMPITDSQCIND